MERSPGHNMKKLRILGHPVDAWIRPRRVRLKWDKHLISKDYVNCRRIQKSLGEQASCNGRNHYVEKSHNRRTVYSSAISAYSDVASSFISLTSSLCVELSETHHLMTINSIRCSLNPMLAQPHAVPRPLPPPAALIYTSSDRLDRIQ